MPQCKIALNNSSGYFCKINHKMLSVSYILYLFVLVYGASFATAQTVEVTFDSPVVRVNSFATARCTVRDAVAQIQPFRWEKDGNLIVSGDRFTITMIDSSSSRLEIEPAELGDAGEYSCSVSFMGGGLIADSTDLKVATELVLTADLEQEFTMTTTATLRCSASSSPAPRIIWSRVVNENTVNVLDQQFPEDQDFGTFTISDVSEDDAGTYRCTARTSLDEESVDIELVVLVPPQIISRSSTLLGVRTDTTIVFNCTATGMRPPTYHWLHNNINIANIIGEDDRIVVNNITGSLIIRNVTFTDTGTYICVATNSAGSDRQENEVTVVGPPVIILNLSDSQRMIRVAEGTRIVFNCPFLSNPPPQFTRWRNPNNDIIVPIEGGRFEDFPNGTLVISVVRAQDTGNYTCEIRNDFGTANLTYNLVALETPGPPRFLVSTNHLDDERAVTLTWQHPSSISITSEVEQYLVELSFDERGFFTSEQSFLGNETSGELFDLLPGETYEIRLRATNLAGVSEPSNIVVHMPPAKPPNLFFFNATAQEDGRSVLVEWELEFDGGSDITEFRVEVSQNGVTVQVFNLNVSLGVYEVRGLNPRTTYEFNAFLSNEEFSEDIMFIAFATTPLAFPSMPTTPTITSVTTHSITLSFSVKFGSRNITHFVVNITEVDSSGNERGIPNQEAIPFDDVRYVESLNVVLDGQGEAVGYEVLLVITSSGHGLKERGRYVFEVAATSELGTGRFSEPSEPVRLEDGRILYYIIVGIVGGVLVIVGIILCGVVSKVCFNRYRLRKQRLPINSNGHRSSRTALTQDPYTDHADSFILQSPPSGHGRQYPRHVVSPMNIDTHSNGINSPSNTEPMGSHKEDLASSSPPYNRLHSYDNGGGPQNIMTHHGTGGGGIDMPDGDMMVHSGNFHSSTSNVPNGSFSPPVDHLSPRQHSQLQTSLSKLSQPSLEGTMNGVRGGKLSVRQMSGSPPQQLLDVPTTMSKSNPMINSRNSFDSTLDSMPTSYMTDV